MLPLLLLVGRRLCQRRALLCLHASQPSHQVTAHLIPSSAPPHTPLSYGEGLVDTGTDEGGVVDKDEVVMSAK